MALKIRLRQQGRKNSHTYRLVVIDGNIRREGKYIEAIGFYDPKAPKEENMLTIKPDRTQYWLEVGAQLSENAEALLNRAAPAVIKKYREQQLERNAKVTAKKRAARKAKAKN